MSGDFDFGGCHHFFFSDAKVLFRVLSPPSEGERMERYKPGSGGEGEEEKREADDGLTPSFAGLAGLCVILWWMMWGVMLCKYYSPVHTQQSNSLHPQNLPPPPPSSILFQEKTALRSNTASVSLMNEIYAAHAWQEAFTRGPSHTPRPGSSPLSSSSSSARKHHFLNHSWALPGKRKAMQKAEGPQWGMCHRSSPLPWFMTRWLKLIS